MQVIENTCNAFNKTKKNITYIFFFKLPRNFLLNDKNNHRYLSASYHSKDNLLFQSGLRKIRVLSNFRHVKHTKNIYVILDRHRNGQSVT